MTAIEPFNVAIPQTQLDDLRDRLARTRWPREIGDNGGWQMGTNLPYLRELVDYWLDAYDWRAREMAMNALPQYRTAINGMPIHFVHARGVGPDPMPLVINHGWPWTFWDMRRIIGPLSDPAAYGGDPADAFHVVAPSLPGFAFSSPVTKPGVFFTPTADMWVELMDRLGYPRFATQGGDVGTMVSTMLGHRHPHRVIGVHLHLLLPTGNHRPTADDYAAEELVWGARTANFMAEKSAYMAIQRTRPMTIAYGMHDSPVGLAAWLIEKRRDWADTGGDIESVFTKDDLIDTVMLYWLTETYLSAAMHYHEPTAEAIRASFRNDNLPVVPPPTAAFQFEGDVMLQPRSWAERFYNLQRWTVSTSGGHFAPMERPEELVSDIRAFFKSLR